MPKSPSPLITKPDEEPQLPLTVDQMHLPLEDSTTEAAEFGTVGRVESRD